MTEQLLNVTYKEVSNLFSRRMLVGCMFRSICST